MSDFINIFRRALEALKSDKKGTLQPEKSKLIDDINKKTK